MNKESLADFVRRVRNEKNISLATVRTRSGNQLATSYISRIENGEVTNVGLAKLKALAKGLGASEEEVFSLAMGNSPNGEKITNEKLAVVSFGYPNMPKQKKEKLDPLIELLEREYQRIISEGE